MIVLQTDDHTTNTADVALTLSFMAMVQLTERTVEAFHAALQTARSHRLNVLVFVAAAEQRLVFHFILRASLRSQLLLLLPACSRQSIATCGAAETLARV